MLLALRDIAEQRHGPVELILQVAGRDRPLHRRKLPRGSHRVDGGRKLQRLALGLDDRRQIFHRKARRVIAQLQNLAQRPSECRLARGFENGHRGVVDIAHALIQITHNNALADRAQRGFEPGALAAQFLLHRVFVERDLDRAGQACGAHRLDQVSESLGHLGALQWSEESVCAVRKITGSRNCCLT